MNRIMKALKNIHRSSTRLTVCLASSWFENVHLKTLKLFAYSYGICVRRMNYKINISQAASFECLQISGEPIGKHIWWILHSSSADSRKGNPRISSAISNHQTRLYAVDETLFIWTIVFIQQNMKNLRQKPPLCFAFTPHNSNKSITKNLLCFKGLWFDFRIPNYKWKKAFNLQCRNAVENDHHSDSR